jgi:hypothetical protein
MLSEARPLLGGHHVSWCQISCRRCDDDHSANRGGPTQYWGASVRGLTTCWIGKSSKWLPPYTANYGCDCLRKVDLGTGSRGNPIDPAITRRETTSRALLVWHVAVKSAGTYAARRGGRLVPRGGNHRSRPAAGARRLQSSPSICDAFRNPASAPGLFLAVALDEVLVQIRRMLICRFSCTPSP